MKRFSIVFFMGLLFLFVGCKPFWGDYIINDTEDLDALAGYTHIMGNLIIRDANGIDELENLSGLETLEYVGGDLQIHNNFGLFNLEGLRNIKSIGGDLRINNNTLLVELRMDSLSLVGGDFEITNNIILGDDDASNLATQVEVRNGIIGNTIISGNN